MSASLYDLSDCLFQFRRWFLQEMAAGTMFTPEQVELIGELLFVSGQTALRRAHELSRLRGSEDGGAGSLTSIARAEALRPDSNVVMLARFVSAIAPKAVT